MSNCGDVKSILRGYDFALGTEPSSGAHHSEFERRASDCLHHDITGRLLRAHQYSWRDRGLFHAHPLRVAPGVVRMAAVRGTEF